MLYNLHTHTFRCNHADGEDREYVEAAIRSGIRVLGFADHCPQFFPGDYYSHFRMRPELAEEYVSSIRALQKEYADDIQILVGFETEYYPELFESFLSFIEPLALDYLIMGQHFVGNEYDLDLYLPNCERDGEKWLEIYVNQVIEGLSTDKFTYLAHPDILDYHGSKEVYEEQMSRLCAFAKEHDIPLEYNILGHVHRKCYPREEFWQIAAKSGCKVTLGFDAHTPSFLEMKGAYYECKTELGRLGIGTVPFEKIQIRRPCSKY